jgi:hypothetical protein
MASSEGAVRGLGASFAWRLFGALRLAKEVFEDIEGDRGALRQAAGLVVVAGLARGLGAFGSEGLAGLVGSPIVALVVWLVAGVLIWGIGVKRFGYSSDYFELLRTTGFAAAPLLFLALCALPLGAFEAWLWAGLHAWAMLVLVIAVREALDVPTMRALVVCALALGVTLAVFFVVGLLLVDWGALD